MKYVLLIGVALFSSHLQAWNCKYEKSIDLELDLSASELLAIDAVAGDLDVKGVDRSSRATIRGRVCVSKESWLDEASVETSTGKRAEIIVALPVVTDGWLLTGQRYAYMDLELEVPRGMALEIRDSSGDVTIHGVGELRIKDSSGDMHIANSRGPVTVWDSSGDIVFTSISEGIIIESDSSGDIRGVEIDGSVLVKKDSSGDIRFTGVGQDYVVERDSSGDISAKDVGGDFKVLRDGSGDIHASGVRGEVIKPAG